MSLIEVDRQHRAGGERLAPRAIATQAVVITAAFLAYLAVRWFANGSEEAAFRHAARLLDVEAALGIDVEKQVQGAVLHLPGVIDFFNFVYAWTYWPYIISTFVIAWFWRRSVFTLYRNAMLISGTVGLIVFSLLPVAPPRFLPGFIDTVGQSGGSAFVGHPDGFINEFAALPSFHVGWVALASAAMFLGTDRRWLKVALVVPVALMSVAVVVTANHYILDIVVGVGLSLSSLAVASRLQRCSTADPEPTPDSGLGLAIVTSSRPSVR